ncbi:MAG: hypothetical protein MK212_08985 [Saprospiraceae bacterium]|nr:hypothetical protein [Saprospiraceae bacterium]
MKLFYSILFFCLVTTMLSAQIAYTNINCIAISPDGQKVAYSGGKDRMAFKIINHEDGKVLAQMPRRSSKKLRFLNNEELVIGTQAVYNWKRNSYRTIEDLYEARLHLKKAKIKIYKEGNTLQLQTETGLPFAHFHYYNDSLRYKSYVERIHGLSSGDLSRYPLNRDNVVNYLNLDNYGIKEVAWATPNKLACDHLALGNALVVDPKEQYLYINTALGNSTLVDLRDLSTRDFDIGFQTQYKVADDCAFSEDGKQLFVLNYRQLAILNVNNPSNIILSDTLNRADGVIRLEPRKDIIYGIGVNRVACWSYKGDLESLVRVEGRVLFVHPKGYIVSYDHKSNNLYFYSLKGNIVKKQTNVYYSLGILGLLTDHRFADIQSTILSADGKRMVCLEADNAKNYTIINLENLK